jgi:hypothetical protein
MNSSVAQDACIAYVTAKGGTAASCLSFGPSDGGAPDSWCAATCSSPTTCTGFNNGSAADCICWTFAGTYMGTYLDPVQQGISDGMCYYGVSSGAFN